MKNPISMGVILLSSLVSSVVALASVTAGTTITFTGSTTDWYTPSNWDLGRLPQAGDDVVIGGGHSVIINPANDPGTATGSGAGAGKVVFQDLSITDGASLETLAGVEMTTRNEVLTNGGQLIHRSTRATDDPLGGTLTALPPSPRSGTGQGGPVFNPTPKAKRDIVLQSTVTFGLGGAIAASNTVPRAFGAGHYATLTTDNATLGGTLDLETFYGFSPSLGETFQIINVGTTRTGTFDGLGEGAFVKSFGNVGMFISYQGGDGNDVVITTGPIPTGT